MSLDIPVPSFLRRFVAGRRTCCDAQWRRSLFRRGEDSAYMEWCAIQFYSRDRRFYEPSYGITR
jgi:hypothetical protein